jgi:hypothetical protein
MTDSQTIPDGIRDTAKHIAEQPWLTRAERDRMAEQIAKAIHDAVMAERERCARLMEDDGEWTFAGDATAMAIFEDVRELAADAIRATPKAEGK